MSNPGIRNWPPIQGKHSALLRRPLCFTGELGGGDRKVDGGQPARYSVARLFFFIWLYNYIISTLKWWCELRKYKFQWRSDHRSGNWNLSNCKLTGKKISGLQRDSNPWPLSYEDPYIGSWPICWVHLNPWREWNIEWWRELRKYKLKWRYDRRSGNCNLSKLLQINPKKIFNL